MDFLANPGAVTLIIMFIWVPFALGAYLLEVRPELSRRRKLVRPTRHTEPTRPMTPAPVH